MGPVVEMVVHVLSKACSSQDPTVGIVDSETGSSQTRTDSGRSVDLLAAPEALFYC